MTSSVSDDERPSALRNLVDDYLMHCEARGLSPRTMHGYRYALDRVFVPWCVEHDIAAVAQLDRRTVDHFTTQLLRRTRPDGKEISRHSVSHYIRPVRLLLGWAKREGEDVRATPQLPRCEQPPLDVLSRDEIQTLEDAKALERDKLILRIFGDCGLRLDELTHLSPDDVVRSGGQGFLRVLGKRARVRDVPVPPQLLRRIERLIATRPVERAEDRIFLAARRNGFGDYAALSAHGVAEVVTDAAARARMKRRVYPHLLRHSWMTEMVRTGMHPFQLSVIAGASPQVIARYYTHLTKSDAYEAMMQSLGVGATRTADRGRMPGGWRRSRSSSATRP